MASSPKTMYRVVNPGAGNDYYNVAGSAYDAKEDFSDDLNPAAQPTYLGGNARNLYSNRSLLDNVAHGFASTVFASQVVGGNNIGYAAWGTQVSADVSVTADSGYAKYTKNEHGLSVGAIVNVTDTNSVVDGPQRITAVTANTFTTTKLYTAGAGTVTYYPSDGTHFASMTAEKWIIRRVTTELAGGVSKTLLRSGASDYQIRRPIHQMEAMRTTRTATAIRAGYWNEYSGSWSTDPTTADDMATFETNGTDDAANPTYAKPGELVYKEPKHIPEMDDYKERHSTTS